MSIEELKRIDYNNRITHILHKLVPKILQSKLHNVLKCAAKYREKQGEHFQQLF